MALPEVEGLERNRDWGQNFAPAPLWKRILAGIVDSLVAGTIAFALVIKVVVPVFFPETLEVIYEYQEQAQGSILFDTSIAHKMAENDLLWNMLLVSQIVMHGVFFTYFLAIEWGLRGSSLGKAMFRIAVAQPFSTEAPNLSNLVIRTGLKTIFILFAAPVFWITFLYAFIQKDRRAIHDLFSRTWVIG